MSLIRVNRHGGQNQEAHSVSGAEMKLNGLIEAINATDGKMMITKNGGPAAVLVRPEEFESLEETMTVRSELNI